MRRPAERRPRCVSAPRAFPCLPGFGEPLFFLLLDITEMAAGGYRIQLALTSGERLALFDLGYQYEDFARQLSRLRNEMLLKSLLMREAVRKTGVKAEGGERFILLGMGNQSDSFANALSQALNALVPEVQSTLREIVPEADPSVIGTSASA